jgi:hypothetical protein
MNILQRMALLGVISAAVAALVLTSTRTRTSEAAISGIVTDTGKLSLSVDGLGTNNSSGTIQVDKPAGGTVRSAHLACAGTGGFGPIPDDAISLDGTPIAWDLHVLNAYPFNSHYADVTSVVSSTLNAAPAGLSDVTVSETSPFAVDGCILAVIFNDPAQTVDRTVVLLFGGQTLSGDTFTITLGDPIDTSDSNLTLDMGLGISYSYQGIDGHACGGGQYSVVDVNGSPLSDCSGNYDDGAPADGALLTVGGVGDSNANPADPANVTEDDELYDLIPFVQDGDTVITVDTVNPSGDDNIFFAHVLTLGSARVTTEICDDEIDNDGDDLVDLNDPDCQDLPESTPTQPAEEDEEEPTATPCIPPLVGYRCDGSSGGGGGGSAATPTVPASQPTPVVSVAPATVVPPAPAQPSGAVISAPDTGHGSGSAGSGSPVALIALGLAGLVLAGAGALRMKAQGTRS